MTNGPTAGSTLGNTINSLSLREPRREREDVPGTLRELGFDEKVVKRCGEILEKDGKKAALEFAIDLIQKQMDKIANDHLDKMRADLDRRGR